MKNTTDNITTATRIDMGIVGALIGALVWILSHILPTEAKVEIHEHQIQSLNDKVSAILENTQYIRAKVDAMEAKQ